MSAEQQSKVKRSAGWQSLVLVVIVLVIILTGWTLVTVSSTLPPRSDFVTLPATPLVKSGMIVTFVNIRSITANGVANGVSGYVLTASGGPVSGVTVYATYYFQGAYRTESATTDQSGYFEIPFPMNWTGSLPITLTYFGDSQHRGVQQVASLGGETLITLTLLQ